MHIFKVPPALVAVVAGYPIHREATAYGPLFLVADTSFMTLTAAESYAASLPRNYAARREYWPAFDSLVVHASRGR